MKNKIRAFLPITKIDNEEQMVYGYASTPEIDCDGEMIKASAFSKSLPNYMKFPTIREMHQPKAIGTTKNAEIKDNGLYIGAKIVDKNAWELVKEGVYKAFSIGGNVVKRVGNIIEELELVEISLVDSPANKQAVIEVWKSEKLRKNAESVYELSNIMMYLKEISSYWEYLGKNTKKLDKMIEQVKELISTEAQEKEEAKAILVETTKAKIVEILENMQFEDNLQAEHIRKGVIEHMKTKKAEGVDKAEEEKVETEVETTEVEDAEVADVEEVATDEEAAPEEDVTEEKEETEEEKSAQTLLEKIAALDEKVDAIKAGKSEKAEAVVEKMDLTKATELISKLTDTVAKQTDLLRDVSERLSKVENLPAPTKSKSAFVLKHAKEEGEGDKDDSAHATEKARLVELEALLKSMGANEFAKAGYSQEAMNLQNKIAQS